MADTLSPTSNLTSTTNERSVELSLVSFNMHGFNQGYSVLNDFCTKGDNYQDIIFLQETWLTCNNLSKVKQFSLNYEAYGISAMDHLLGNGILKGRPFGGVFTLVNCSLIKSIKYHKCTERFVAIVIDNLTLINAYFPQINNETDYCIFQSMLADIEHIIDIYPGNKIVCGGDINTNIDKNSNASKLINDFNKNLSLISCNKIINSNLNYTYCHETLQHYSYIDYFFISNSMCSNLKDFKILDLFNNLSDHLPIMIKLQCLPRDMDDAESPPKELQNSKILHKQLRWDHASLPNYYAYSRSLLQPIFDELVQLNAELINFTCCTLESINCDVLNLLTKAHIDSSLDPGCNLHKGSRSGPIYHKHDCCIRFKIVNCINNVYSNLVTALKHSADCTIPCVKSNFFKFWWNQETEELKHNSLVTHRDWIDSGRPGSGAIYEKKRVAKALYKKCIRNNKKIENETVSNNLHDALISKNQTQFWKIWKSKFGKGRLPKVVNNTSDEQSIANHFAKYFAETCSADYSDQVFIDKFYDTLNNYELDNPKQLSVNVEMVDDIVQRLQKGKAASVDELSVEHIQFAHPVVISIMSMLFNLMLQYEHVPPGFGIGITVPIPKIDLFNNSCNVSDFRGITISPVISKIFELCLVNILDDYLFTSDLQFGFKKGIGCNHAIYTLRSTVDHFVKNNSTVKLCSLDLTKAFDKVNYFQLFNKLLEKKFPRKIIVILLTWYLNTSITVRWKNCLSESVALKAGIRQGGVLSPYLFAIFVDDVLKKLQFSKLGCRVYGLILNAIMYADDLMLMASSLTDLQSMVNLCVNEFRSLGLSINIKKSHCIFIGPKYGQDISSITIDDQEIQWKNELKFLGVNIYSGSTIKLNLQSPRQKFFRAVNGIFGKIGVKSTECVILSLIQSYCLPMLLYGIECFDTNKQMYNKLESAYSACFAKVYSISDNQNIRQCQFFSGYLPISYLIDIKRIHFLNGIMKTGNFSLNVLYNSSSKREYSKLLLKHNLTCSTVKYCKQSMWAKFENELFVM